MSGEITARNHARRNRLIAVAAGAITVIAIVLGFAGDVLGLAWHWMRPAAELLLLAELVGLIVLERHQLFEPVHQKVNVIESQTARIDTKLDALAELITASGLATVSISPPEVLRALTRITREALARDHETPQILRVAGLSGRSLFGEHWELESEAREYLATFSTCFLFSGSPSDSRARQWSVRVLGVFAEKANFDRFWERSSPLINNKPLNLEVKLLVRCPVQAQLSPQTITDRDVIAALDDHTSAFHWGIHFQGRQYVMLFANWFDELWATIPGGRLVYSRNGFDQAALDEFRKELATAEFTNNGRVP
jgi:hypothetical protein